MISVIVIACLIAVVSSDACDGCDPRIKSVELFKPWEDGFPCIRVPSIVRTPHALIAYAECRMVIGDGCIPDSAVPLPRDNAMYVCQKKSVDGGKTWGNLTYPFGKTIATREASPVYDWKNHKLLVVANLMDAQLIMTTSDDEGDTYTPMENIEEKVGGAHTTYVGVGHGLQLRYGPHAGRLLFIGHHGAYEYDPVWYTDDLGKSWTASNTYFKKMDEAQLVELGDGIVMANMRNQHLNGTARGIAVSTDGGDNFGEIYYDPVLVDPINAASIIRDYSTDVVYFSNAAHPTTRVRMTVKRSVDFTKTWGSELLVFEGPSAYSDMIDLEDEEYIGLTWETNSTGCKGESCRTLFSFVPKKFLFVC
ncbi:hypothetical protein WA171_000221 [Blastocystis sp. BT1]